MCLNHFDWVLAHVLVCIADHEGIFSLICEIPIVAAASVSCRKHREDALFKGVDSVLQCLDEA